MAANLGLDEALVTVNKTTASPIEVLYQNQECFDCPLNKLKILEENLDSFVISTKFNLELELRRPNQSETNGCRFHDLSLNSRGLYRINLDELPGGALRCNLQTIDRGECLLCPFAILICFLFLVTAIEKIYTRFWSSNKRHQAGDDKSTNDSSDTSLEANGNQQNDQNNNDDNDRPSNDRQTALPAGRVDALDAFRGFTITGMIFVNYGGAGYGLLEHKPWNGITLADFVFPFFIFAMGASIAISTRSMVKRHKRSFQQVCLKIFRRALILASLGLCLNSKWLNYDKDNLNSLRLTGVLQRFSVSYLVVALMYTIELTIKKWIKAQSISQVPILSRLVGATFEILTAINYLAIYVFVTFFLDYDSKCPAGYIGPGGLTEGGKYANCTGGAAAWLDRLVLGTNHLYHDREVKQVFQTQVTHDPEGILGCTTSILLTLAGLQCGKILIKRRQQQEGRSIHRQRSMELIQWIALLSVLCSLVPIIPINKRLWSLTFVIATGAAAFLTILLLYLMLDVYKCQKPLLVRLILAAGKNSIFLYVGHSLLSGMLPWWFPVDETSHLQLLVRLTWATFVWLLVARYMEMKRIFVKV